jgi:hypothetical protein
VKSREAEIVSVPCCKRGEGGWRKERREREEEGDTTASDNYVNIRPRALITPVAMPTSLAVAAAVFSLTGRQAVQGSQLPSADVATV